MRRFLGLLICFSPLGIALGSMIHAIQDPVSNRTGLTLALIGLLIGLLNGYLSFGRPSIHRWRYGDLNDYHHASGVPLLGSVIVTVATSIGYGDLRVGIVGIVTLVIDTGGLPWFLIMTWRDRAFWNHGIPTDEKAQTPDRS